MSNDTILRARGIFKSYHKDKIEVPVLRGVDIDITPGIVTALVGRSGSGKSTLMHLLATLDQPDEGEIYFRGQRIDNASRAVRDAYRNHQIGIIFQFYHLLPELSALENVLAPV
ncbi:MAG: ATP-binding cassette domain-containing protein, partial [Pirellulales bacterium]|nr:ATP-binding cassette domain-containing protein [Pirellulales bacterium]